MTAYEYTKKQKSLVAFVRDNILNADIANF